MCHVCMYWCVYILCVYLYVYMCMYVQVMLGNIKYHCHCYCVKLNMFFTVFVLSFTYYKVMMHKSQLLYCQNITCANSNNTMSTDIVKQIYSFYNM